MKKISKNKIDKILKLANAGFTKSVISLATKISVPTVRKIIRQQNQTNGLLSENTNTSYMQNAVGPGYYPSQSQIPIQMPENPPYPNIPDNYWHQQFVEYQMIMQKERELEREQHRQELGRRDQQISDLTQKLNQKAYKEKELEREIEKLSKQQTKEYENNQKLFLETKKDYSTFVEQIETLKNENDQLRHALKTKIENSRQTLDANDPMATGIQQPSPSQNTQSGGGGPVDQELNTAEKNSVNSWKNLMHPTTEIGKTNDDTGSGTDILLYAIKTTTSIGNGILKGLATSGNARNSGDMNNQGRDQMFNAKDPLGQPIKRYLPDGIKLGCPSVFRREQ